MKILQKIQKQLSEEFPDISPTLIKSVIWFISGGMNHETFAEKSARLLSGIELSNEDEEHEFIYNILLNSGRDACQSQALLNHFKSALQQSTAQVKQKKSVTESSVSGFQSSVAALNADSGSSALFDGKKGKRHLADESIDLARKKTAQTTSAQGPSTRSRH